MKKAKVSEVTKAPEVAKVKTEPDRSNYPGIQQMLLHALEFDAQSRAEAAKGTEAQRVAA